MYLQLCSPHFQIGDFVGYVGFGGSAIYWTFGSYVYLLVSNLQPEAASVLQGSGFLDFLQAEQVAIEAAALGL
jgi:hypothetical protein